MASRVLANPRLPFELQPHEEEILIAHRHWAYLAKKLGRDIAFGILPVIAVIVIIAATTGFGGALGGVAWAIIGAWLAFWAIKAYFTWYKYQNDIWVVTNQRLVDSMRSNWFNHRMASAALVNIQDMSVDQHGMLATAFHYGDLVCQTAGSRANFVLSGVPDPAALLNQIDSARERARSHYPGGANGER